MFKHIPNLLTILRLLLVPVFPVVYFSTTPNAMYYALGIFIVAGITDVLDGYIARKYQLTSVIGTALDPLADKLMLLTALTCLYMSSHLPLIILVIMYIKEFTMMLTGVYMYFHKENVVVASNLFGKLATVIFSLAVVLTMLLPHSQFHIVLLYIALLFKLMAFTSYTLNFFKNAKSKLPA